MDGYSYDASGNLLNDGSSAFTYDAEGRIHTAIRSGVTTTYVYDAAGRRVRKTVGSTSTDFLYNLAGEAVAEVNGSGAWTRGEVFVGGRHLATYAGGSTGTTYFNHADWLGTERVRSDMNGAACETITSLLFGDGMATSGACGDESTRHFTGKQHDDESNLDDFGRRYYSSQFGRFVSADWSDIPVAVPYADLTNPQTLNLYALVRGNPSTFADLDGHMAPGQLGFSGGMGITGRMRSANGNAYGCLDSGCDSYQTVWELTLQYGDGTTTIEFFDSEAQAKAAAAQAGAQIQNQSVGNTGYDSSKSGPADPTNPSQPLFQNKLVSKASDDAFMRTRNGNARDGLAEAGFAIEYKDGKISIDHRVDSLHGDKKANELQITTDTNTIAILHTHGNKGVPTPSLPTRDSPGDVGSRFPNFVRSQSALYVTVPGTTNYIQLIPAQSH